MRSFLMRLYPALFVAVVFIGVGWRFSGFLDTIDYVAAYLMFGFFYLPVLLKKSIWEITELPKPRLIRNWVLARKQKELDKGPLNHKRITIVFSIFLFLLMLMMVPTAEYLSEADSAAREELRDISVIDRLLLPAGILLSCVVALTLLVSNLLRRSLVDWNVKKRVELSVELSGCMHAVNLGLLVVLSPMLLMATRSGQFISGNFGLLVLLMVQGLIALVLLLGDRFLREN